MHQYRLAWFCVLCAACGSVGERKLATLPASDLAKIEQRVLDDLNSQSATTVIIRLVEKAEFHADANLDWRTRGQNTVSALRSVAAGSQVAVLNYLSANPGRRKVFDVESLWICNCVVATADEDTIATLAQRSDVKSIRANQAIPVDLEPAVEAPGAITSVEWNIAKIRANDVWRDFSITGNGITVGTMDTGVQWDHPALKEKYRGWDGSAADHNYNWFDATRAGSRTPVDPYGHGTHTAGTMVGDDGATNQIGVAPGAKWIASAIIDSGAAFLVATHRGFQWMIAPTDLDGNNPNPDLRPVAVNNSWGCFSAIPECSNFEEFRDDVDAWIAAGIFPEFSAGNEGSRGDRTMRWPASYAESFSTGATDERDLIAGFSSRGPGRDGTVKPEVTAPGVNVRSSFPGGRYVLMGGTSMAGPHVVGLVALLLEANPALTNNDLVNIIESTAVPLGSPIPNNTFGWGRIDAYDAVQAALSPSRKP